MPPSLKQAQASLIRVIEQGPMALDHSLFTGPIDRVLLGLKAHANTISHARLIALEETYLMTRKHMGEEAFNQLSRAFVATDAAQGSDNNTIGAHLPNFLKTQAIHPSAVELAHIEWAWLESYHATDAKALGVTDIAELDETALLNLRITAHPATRMIETNAPLSPQLGQLECDTSHISDIKAVLVIRPDTEVRLLAIDHVTATIFATCQKITTIGNLLSLSTEYTDEDKAFEPVLTLISSGALVSRSK